MDSAKSPRQFLQALCTAWRRYIALPHGRANMDDLRDVDVEVLKLRPDSLLGNKASDSGSARYHLLLGQLLLDADVFNLASDVLEATSQRVTSDGCNATAALSTVIITGPATSALHLLFSASTALGIITDAMEPAQGQPAVPAEEQLLGGGRGMTAGGVRDRLLEQLSDVRLHRAVAEVFVAFGSQTEALESALNAGHDEGRAIRSRARSNMTDALHSIQQARLVWLPDAARMLRACVKAATFSEMAVAAAAAAAVVGGSGGGRRASAALAGPTPKAQRLLGALEDSCLLELVCREMLMLPGSCTKDAFQTQALCSIAEELGETLRTLATLVRCRVRGLSAGGPLGPGGTSSESAERKGGRQPLAGPGASSPTPGEGVVQAARLLLSDDVQDLQLCTLRRWVAQHAPRIEQGAHGEAHGDGGASPAADERSAPSCGWAVMDAAAFGDGSADLQDDRALPEPALRAWQAVWEVWEALGEGTMAEQGLAGEPAEAAHGVGGGGGSSCLMPVFLLTPQDMRVELLRFLQAAQRAVGLLGEGGGGGGGGGDGAGGGGGGGGGSAPSGASSAMHRIARARALALDVGTAVDILTHVHTWQAQRFPPPPPEPKERQQQAHLAEALVGLEAAGRALNALTVLGSKLGRELGPPPAQGQGQEGRERAGVVPGLGQGSGEAGRLTGTDEQLLQAGVQGVRSAVEDYGFKAVYVIARMCRYCSGFPDPTLEDSDDEDEGTASEAAAPPATASAGSPSAASACPTAATSTGSTSAAASANSQSSTPASTASIAAAASTPCAPYTKQAVSDAVCLGLLHTGWMDSLAQLARMAGAALARDDGSMHDILQHTLSTGVHSATAAMQLRVAAVHSGTGGAGPGADPSAAAHSLAWLLESTGKVALCACSRLEDSLEGAQQRAVQREGLRRGRACGSSNRGGSGAHATLRQQQQRQQQQLEDTLDEQCREQLQGAAEAAGSWASLLNKQVVELLTVLYGPTGWYDAGEILLDYSSAAKYVQAVATVNTHVAASVRPHLSSSDHATLRGAAAYCALASCRLATCQLEAGEVLPAEDSPAWARPLSTACELLTYPLCDWVPPRQLLVRANPLRLFEAALRRLVGGMEEAGGGGGGAPGQGGVGTAALRVAAHAGARVLGAMARMAASEQLAPHVAAWLMAQPLGVRQEPTAVGSRGGRAGGAGGGSGRSTSSSGTALGSWADAVVLVADQLDRVYGRQWWAVWAGRLVEAAGEAAAGGAEGGREAGEAEAAGGGAAGLREAALALCVEWHGEVWPGGELPAGLVGRSGRQRGQGAMTAAGAPAVGWEEGAGRQSGVEAEEGGVALGAAGYGGVGSGTGEVAGMESGQVVEVLWPRVCANERCQSFLGERDAALGLRRCGRCDARYCCRECQTADWRAGHRRECGAGGG